MMSAGLEMLAVPRLSDGPDLEVLRALCIEHRPRFFFLGTALHNPTGTHVVPHKAFQILRLAEEFNLTLVEDDTYGDLIPGGAAGAVTRLASLDQLQRVIYIGSFSKTMAPGLRVGYLAASSERIEWMATYRALNCLASNSLAERIVYRLLSEGSYRHHCEQLRARLADVRPRAADALQRLGLTLTHEPDAGLYLWADLGEGVDAFKVSQQLLEQGHLTAPGRLFSLAHASHMRFNIATTLEGDALSALARAIGR
jgi:DNA-binding transcriptional MocR family regulator